MFLKITEVVKRCKLSIYLVVIHWITIRGSNALKQCAEISILNPKINDGILNAQENTSVEITFNIVNNNCSDWEKFQIEISRFNYIDLIYMPQCKILQFNDSCRGAPVHRHIKCRCLDEHGPYVFEKIISRSDNTSWYWSTTDSMTEDLIITLNVTGESNVLVESSDGYLDLRTLGFSLAITILFCLTLCNSAVLARIVVIMRRSKDAGHLDIAARENTDETLNAVTYIKRRSIRSTDLETRLRTNVPSTDYLTPMRYDSTQFKNASYVVNADYQEICDTSL